MSRSEDALRQAETEGLTLLKADTSSGYRGVSFDSRKKTKPYSAQVWRASKYVRLGRFATAEEAALAFARASAPHTASLRKRKAEPEEERENAEEEDDVEVVVLDAYELHQPVATGVTGAERTQEGRSEELEHVRWLTAEDLLPDRQYSLK